MPKLNKKLTISLTEEDFNYVKTAAENDLRSTAQYVSLMILRDIKNKRTNSEKVVKAA